MADLFDQQLVDFRRQQQLQEDVEFDDTGSADEKAATELLERLKALPKESRRRTLQHFKGEYDNDDDMSYFQKSSRRETLYQPGTRGYQPDSVPQQQTTERTVYVSSQPQRLKPFSGKKKPAPGEVGYRQWRRAAMRLIEDADMQESRKKGLILTSLQGKADDIVDFHREQSLLQIMDSLDATYKHFVDGDDLLADFY